ncbi:hypothetical protein L1049_015276 [Liquidambar formosana]|uniref:CBS domain-containing protein n=1 Tax=Liquidambar formosana TaxID=63359 RepID=A0AAP0X6E4_LIQFO
MDLRQIEEVIKDTEGGMVEKKETLISNLTNDGKKGIDAGSALQLFLDHIPISSIPGIKNSPVVELNIGDSVRDAIQLLYEKNVYGAPIVDVVDSDGTARRFSDRYVGFIDIASMFLWALEECEKARMNNFKVVTDEISKTGFFYMLEQNPQIGQTKVGELAKSFLMDPFLPVHLDDTLFHVLLLFSKHRLQVVPVTEQPNSQVIGFITPNAVIQLLLQSSGLDWFDCIADKFLSEFQFEHEEHNVRVYGDQSIAEAIDIIWNDQIDAIAVVDRGTERAIGCVRSTDIHLLLDNDSLFHNRKNLNVEEFIHFDASKTDSDPTIKRDLGALLSAGVLRLRNSFIPRMVSPVTNKKTETLKEAMRKLAETKSNFSFLVDELQQVKGVVKLRDIIIQFAPPCIDSRIDGGGFFESALEQTGCHVENGTVICDH